MRVLLPGLRSSPCPLAEREGIPTAETYLRKASKKLGKAVVGEAGMLMPKRSKANEWSRQNHIHTLRHDHH